MRCSICNSRLEAHEIKPEIINGKINWMPCNACQLAIERDNLALERTVKLRNKKRDR